LLPLSKINPIFTRNFYDLKLFNSYDRADFYLVSMDSIAHQHALTFLQVTSKYTEAFDTVFESEDINIIRTPYRAPNANAFAERFVRSIREEVLDKVLIINEAHLRRVLIEFLDYYNRRRPHQGLDQQSPIERPEPLTEGLIRRRPVLGGIINDYFRVPPLNAAAQPT